MPIESNYELLIGAEDLECVQRLIKEKCGLTFAGIREDTLLRRLEARIRSRRMRSLRDYYFFLKYASEGREELGGLVDELTINETFFFRNAPQFEFFETAALQAIIASRRKAVQPTIRIWSAGCSSGEEPYSIAIAVLDVLGLEARNWAIRIFATDINRRILDVATAGIYDDWSMRRMTPLRRERYFSASENGKWKISDAVKRTVIFEQRNLLSEAPEMNPFNLDCIFCRNVLIYFDESVSKKLVNNFYDSLRPGGFLFLGHSESLHNVTGAFDVVLKPGVVVYRRPDAT